MNVCVHVRVRVWYSTSLLITHKSLAHIGCVCTVYAMHSTKDHCHGLFFSNALVFGIGIVFYSFYINWSQTRELWIFNQCNLSQCSFWNKHFDLCYARPATHSSICIHFMVNYRKSHYMKYICIVYIFLHYIN